MTRILIGAGVGLIAGGVIGYFGRCSSGTCPLTGSRYGGALFGAVLGALIASSLGGGCSREGTIAHSKEVTAVQTMEQFEQHVINADTPVLVDFYATWCPPCKALAPVIDSLATDYKGKVAFVKVDIDKARDLTAQYKIQGVPTLVLFAEGKEVQRLVGGRPEMELRAELDALISR